MPLCLFFATIMLSLVSVPVRTHLMKRTSLISRLQQTTTMMVNEHSSSSGGSRATSLRDVNLIGQHRFSVAPMMEYTDRFQRFFMRQLSKESVLYTEMVTASAIIHSDDETRRRLLAADFILEEPLVLQLGGADPEQMKRAVSIALQYGYRQFNINCGCPSEKVSGSGCFGAALMLQPELVGRLANAVFEASGSLATIKCRIGVNDIESYESLASFVDIVHRIAGVQHFVIHARKAVLNKNFSPHDNRNIPPLKYDFVYDLVRDFPYISFTLNGGVKTYEDVLSHLKHGVVGVMVGRGAIDDPFYWSKIDQKIYNKESVGAGLSLPTRRSVMDAYVEYADRMEKLEGKKARRALLKPILNLFSGQKNGRRFRSLMDTHIKDENRPVGSGVIHAAAACLLPEALDG